MGVPEVDIDRKIVAAVFCPLDYKCLKGERDTLCRVEKDAGFFLCVSAPAECPDQCPNSLTLSTGRFCNCEVRKEIYRKYGF